MYAIYKIICLCVSTMNQLFIICVYSRFVHNLYRIFIYFPRPTNISTNLKCQSISIVYCIVAVNTAMSTAKRLVLSLRGRKECQNTGGGNSSQRLVSGNSSSPGHELDEIAVVSGSGEPCHTISYGSLGQPNGPIYAPPSM